MVNLTNTKQQTTLTCRQRLVRHPRYRVSTVICSVTILSDIINSVKQSTIKSPKKSQHESQQPRIRIGIVVSFKSQSPKYYHQTAFDQKFLLNVVNASKNLMSAKRIVFLGYG